MNALLWLYLGGTLATGLIEWLDEQIGLADDDPEWVRALRVIIWPALAGWLVGAVLRDRFTLRRRVPASEGNAGE